MLAFNSIEFVEDHHRRPHPNKGFSDVVWRGIFRKQLARRVIVGSFLWDEADFRFVAVVLDEYFI